MGRPLHFFIPLSHLKNSFIIVAAHCAIVSLLGCGIIGDSPEATTKEPITNWPPQLNQPYPDVEFTDIHGKPVRISDFKGKIVLIEPIGQDCAACNAFAGGNRAGGPGGFKGTPPQGDVRSIDEIIARFGGGISLNDPEIVYLHALFFGMKLQEVDIDAAKAWDKHFGVSANKNRKVIFGDGRFLEKKHYQATYDLIPGFQLVDRNGILRIDATGHTPTHGISQNLIPMIEHLLYE